MTLQGLRALSEAATPGPWHVGSTEGVADGVWAKPGAITGVDDDGDTTNLIAWCHSDWRDEADAAFIVAAVNFVRELLDDPAPDIRIGLDVLRERLG